MTNPSSKRVAALYLAGKKSVEASHGPSSDRVAALHLALRGRTKTAGEVVFKKDRGDDVGSWAYNNIPPSKREIPGDFNYSPRNQKPLAKILRATLAALGHTLSGYNRFAKIKSARVSPDGAMGGRGYIQKIADMRKQYMNCVEALSALADTLYDEIHAPHWSVMSRQEEEGDKAEVKELIGDVEQIRENPQQWAEQEMREEFDQDRPKEVLERVDPDDWDSWGDETEVETTVPIIMQKQAGISSRLADKWLAERKEN